jgi:hypothetical protein
MCLPGAFVAPFVTALQVEQISHNEFEMQLRDEAVRFSVEASASTSFQRAFVSMPDEAGLN